MLTDRDKAIMRGMMDAITTKASNGQGQLRLPAVSSATVAVDVQPVVDAMLGMDAARREEAATAEAQRRAEFEQFIAAALAIRGEPQDLAPLVAEVRALAEVVANGMAAVLRAVADLRPAAPATTPGRTVYLKRDDAGNWVGEVKEGTQ